MGDTYRWTLSEYVLRCEDGDELVEVLTEGGLDRDLFTDAVDRWGTHQAVVIDADYIAVTANELLGANQPSGAKGRLVTVAIGLEERASEARIGARVAVVVDRDYEDPTAVSRFLFYTDGYSIESYALDVAVIDRFVRLGLGGGTRAAGRGGAASPAVNVCSGEDIVARLRNPANGVAAVRLALRELSPPLAPFDGWTRLVADEGDGFMSLDGGLLLKRVLEQHGRITEYPRSEARRKRAIEELEADPFRLWRGHDVICLLRKLLQSRWGCRMAGTKAKAWSESAIARMLFLAMPPDWLDDTPLFRSVRKHLSSGPATAS